MNELMDAVDGGSLIQQSFHHADKFSANFPPRTFIFKNEKRTLRIIMLAKMIY